MRALRNTVNFLANISKDRTYLIIHSGRVAKIRRQTKGNAEVAKNEMTTGEAERNDGFL